MMAVRSGLFMSFFTGLDSAGIDYVIVGRTDGFPEQISSDVDFVVRPADLGRVCDMLWNWRAGAQLSQVLQHEIGAFYFVLTARFGDSFVHFHPDVSADYRRRARNWLSADFLLTNRVRDPAGFWVPGAPAAFAYYLVKRIDKLALGETQAQYLESVLRRDSKGCEAVGRRLLGDAAWEALRPHLTACSSVPAATLAELQHALITRAPRDSMAEQIRGKWLEGRRLLRRVMRPTGLVIAVLGPDGAGKSTVIDGLRSELAQVYRRTDYFHLRPRLLRRGGAGNTPATDPHALPPRGAVASLAKLVMFVADAWLGHALRVFPLKRRSSLVIFDRYAQDMLADPLRYRLSTPRWLNALLLWPVPLPDLWLVLDAPAETLLARKAEVSPAACADQLAGYRRLIKQLPHAVRIDTAQPQAGSIAAACEAVLARKRELLSEPVI